MTQVVPGDRRPSEEAVVGWGCANGRPDRTTRPAAAAHDQELEQHPDARPTEQESQESRGMGPIAEPRPTQGGSHAQRGRLVAARLDRRGTAEFGRGASRRAGLGHNQRRTRVV